MTASPKGADRGDCIGGKHHRGSLVLFCVNCDAELDGGSVLRVKAIRGTKHFEILQRAIFALEKLGNHTALELATRVKWIRDGVSDDN